MATIVSPPQLPSLAWQLEEQLGKGAFGSVYKASVIQKDGGTQCPPSYVAIKFEPLSKANTVAKEEHDLKKLADAVEGFCKLSCDVFVTDEHRVLVMEMLGHSLQELFDDHGPVNLQTLVNLAGQMLHRLEYIHGKDIIHRDVKPANFCIGYGAKANIVYLIDFGLSTFWQGAQLKANVGGKFAKLKLAAKSVAVCGTARFCSLNVSKGLRASRRDDVEGLAYTLIYLHQKWLPWMGALGTNKRDKNANITCIKEDTPLVNVCQGGRVKEELPSEFVDFLKHCRSLAFEDAPDYAHLRELMKRVSEREGFLGLDLQWHHLAITTQKDMVHAFSGILSSRGGVIKKANEPPVMARPAEPGEQVMTIINGVVVTVTMVDADDSASMVVRAHTDDHELYLLSEAKFAKYFFTTGWEITDAGLDFDYLRDLGFQYYNRKGETLVYQVTEDDMKHVPSGQFYVNFSSMPQPLRVGDWIATPADPNEEEIYLYKRACNDAPSMLQPTSQEQMVEAFLHSSDKLAQGKLIQKSGFVLARVAKKGEIVATVIDGKLVSKSEVRDEDSMVVIVGGPTAKQYRLVYSRKSFNRFFENTNGSDLQPIPLSKSKSQAAQGFTHFQRRGATLVYQVTQEDILHFVPSGQFIAPFSDMPQPLRAGNYIATPADTKDEVYLYSHVKNYDDPTPSDLLVERPAPDLEKAAWRYNDVVSCIGRVAWRLCCSRT